MLLTPVIIRRDLTYLEFFFSNACCFIYFGQEPDRFNIYGESNVSYRDNKDEK